MANKQSAPSIHIDMSGVKVNAGDHNVNVGWDGVTVDGKKVELTTSFSSTVCIDNKCKACINTECFDFECDDKAKIKNGDIYCGDKKIKKK